MNENPTPSVEDAQPGTRPGTQPATQEALPAPRRTLRDRLPSGRRAVAAGAVLAGLAIGGAGFGAGYAVADPSDAATTQTTDGQTTDGWDDRPTPPGGGPGEMGGPMEGQMGGMPGGATQGDGGTTGELPDFDGDGHPDIDSGSDTGTEPSTQNS